jgi:hypothetical protein
MKVLVSPFSFGRKVGSIDGECGGKRPFSVCTALQNSTICSYANTKQPVVLTAFAAKALCGKKPYGLHLIFWFFCITTKEQQRK